MASEMHPAVNWSELMEQAGRHDSMTPMPRPVIRSATVLTTNSQQESTIQSLLAERGYEITGGNDKKLPSLLEQLAVRLTRDDYRSKAVRAFVKFIRAAYTHPEENRLYFQLCDFLEPEKERIVALANELARLGFCPQSHYSAVTNQFAFTLNRCGNAIQFLSGLWLEYGLTSIVRGIAVEFSEDWEIAQGLKIRNLKDGVENELDCVLRVGKQLYWVECKTGGYLDSLVKYYELGKRLGVVPVRTFLVSPDLDGQEALAETLSYNYSYHIGGLESFEAALREVLTRDKEAQDRAVA